MIYGSCANKVYPVRINIFDFIASGITKPKPSVAPFESIIEGQTNTSLIECSNPNSFLLALPNSVTLLSKFNNAITKVKDDLQNVMAMVREADLDFPVQFTNYK